MFRAILLCTAFLAGPACASAVDQEQTVYVMRHLPKAEGSDPPLTPTGAAQAAVLADLLADRGIKAIYATSTRRAQETAAPLASRLGIGVQLYDPKDPGALVSSVRKAKGNALVVGHSNTVPDLVTRFGGTAPAAMTEQDYGTVFIVGRKGTTTVSLGEPVAR